MSSLNGNGALHTQPDNTNLCAYLEAWKTDKTPDNYMKILNELVTGNCLLMLPSINEEDPNSDWHEEKKADSLQLTSVFEIDGLKILGAFSNEQDMLNWAKKSTPYTALKAKDVLDFCEKNNLDKIIIDNHFVIERNTENVQQQTIKGGQEVIVWQPRVPIGGTLLEKLVSNFKTVSTIEEVHHFGMTRGDEHIYILAFKMSVYNDNSRTACVNAIQNSIEDETLDFPLEMLFLDNETWEKTVVDMNGEALIYPKEES